MNKATIGFTGDIMSHLGFVIQETEGHSFADNFDDEVIGLCNSVDEMWGNLEGPATLRTDGIEIHRTLKRNGCRYPKLFFPRHYLPVLRSLNFTLFGIANNHCFDFETPDDTSVTQSVVNAAGFDSAGLDFHPVIREVNGISFAVFSTTCIMNLPGGRRVARLDNNTLPTLIRNIDRWQAEVDYVVVMTHWGRDYQAMPGEPIRRLARQLIDAGANVIYGNHPHVLWPVERIAADQIICYSLGNFSQVFGCASCDQTPYTLALDGAILAMEFSSSSIEVVKYPLKTEQNYRVWFQAVGLKKSYWVWGDRELEIWRAGLPNRSESLRTTIRRIGAPEILENPNRTRERAALA